MTYHQTLWRNEDVAGRTRRRWRGSVPRQPRGAAKARTPRDAGLARRRRARCSATATPPRAAQQYADAMGRLYARDPDDPDVASFYALALLGTMSRSLIGTCRRARRAQPGAGRQRHAGARRGDSRPRAARASRAPGRAPLPAAQRRRSGARARSALAAARTLARLAPDSSHARHMPAHIFLQLGLWQDAARRGPRRRSPRPMRGLRASGCRRRCATTTRCRGCRTSCCSSGRYREARATIDELAPVVKASGAADAAERPVVDARALRDRNRELAAAGDGEQLRQRQRAVRHRHQRGATPATGARGARAAGARPSARRIRAKAICGRRSRSWSARSRALIALARRAARTKRSRFCARRREREAQLPAPLGLPAPIKPAPELLGEVLVELGRPAEAIPSFEASAARHRNRSLLSLSRSVSARGDHSGGDRRRRSRRH